VAARYPAVSQDYVNCLHQMWFGVCQVQASCEQAMRLCHRTMSINCTKCGLVCDRCKPAVSRPCGCGGYCFDCHYYNYRTHNMWFGV